MSIIENIQSFSDLGKYTGTVFIDLWKAFDTLDHNILHTKKKKKKRALWCQGNMGLSVNSMRWH